MSVYDERPWLALYGDQPADYSIEFGNALEMFRAGVAREPSAVALAYFDGSITPQEPREPSGGLAARVVGNGLAPGGPPGGLPPKPSPLLISMGGPRGG